MLAEDESNRLKPPAKHEIGSDLTAVSVDELDERIVLLETEIERLRAEKAKKQASKAAASAFFR